MKDLVSRLQELFSPKCALEIPTGNCVPRDLKISILCVLVQLAHAGGRLIIASDGVWDAMSTKRAAKCCRGVPRPEVAAKYVVKVGVCELNEFC